MTRVNEMLKVFERAQSTLDNAQLQDFFPSARPNEPVSEKSPISTMLMQMLTLASKATQAADALMDLMKSIDELKVESSSAAKMKDVHESPLGAELQAAALRALSDPSVSKAMAEAHDEDCEHGEGDYAPIPEPTFDAKRLGRLLHAKTKGNSVEWDATLSEYFVRARLGSGIAEDPIYRHIASIQLGLAVSPNHLDPLVLGAWFNHPSVEKRLKNAGYQVTAKLHTQGSIASLHVERLKS